MNRSASASKQPCAAICPSCNQRKASAATSRDGLCDQCAGRGRWKPT